MGSLSKGEHLDELPASIVSIQPAQLRPGETEFTLLADATGYRGATYVGEVQAVTDGAVTTPVHVWITVP